MLKIIWNKLKPQAEKIIVEEKAGFRAGRNTTEHIFNLRVLCKKHLHHLLELDHVFIHSKKAFNRVWHAALRATMKTYNISANLCDKATSAVLFNGSIEDCFQTTVGV